MKLVMHDSWADRYTGELKIQTLGEKKWRYYACCVDLTGKQVRYITTGAREITYDSFRRAVGTGEIRTFEDALGYTGSGLSLRRDWHVAYYSNRVHGCDVYYLVHSHMEWVWVRDDEDPFEAGRKNMAWQLYKKKGAALAERELDKVVADAISDLDGRVHSGSTVPEAAKAVYTTLVYPVLKKHENLGALDTEPRGEAMRRIEDHAFVRYGADVDLYWEV